MNARTFVNQIFNDNKVRSRYVHWIIQQALKDAEIHTLGQTAAMKQFTLSPDATAQLQPAAQNLRDNVQRSPVLQEIETVIQSVIKQLDAPD